MTELPEPLTPAGSQGRMLGPMPFDSDAWVNFAAWVHLSPRQQIARLTLMIWSWNGKPAASIPNLRERWHRLAGESKSWWKTHGSIVAEPWIQCSDERWYHPWLAEQANERLLSPSKQRRHLGISQGEWQRRRAFVFERDDYTCRYCNVRGGILHCDHVLPLAGGGSSDIDNLATACADCNQSKNGRSPEAWRGKAA